MTDKNAKIPLCLILLFASALRLYGITFEIPHPDDYITVQAAMHFGPAQVTPTGYGLYGLYVWPAFTLVIIQTILFSSYFFLGWLVGYFPDIGAFKRLYITDPSSFYLVGRLVCVAFAVATIYLVYDIGSKLRNHKVGLFASLFLSVSFIHSFHSQFIRPDVPATFFIILSLLLCLKIVERQDLKYYIYAGTIAGLAIATKFTSVIVILSIFAAHVLAERTKLFEDSNILNRKKLFSVSIITIGSLLLMSSFAMSRMAIPEFIALHFSPDGNLNRETLSLLGSLMGGGILIGIVIVVVGLLSLFIAGVGNLAVNLFTSKKLVASACAILATFAVFDPLFFLDFKNQVQVFLNDANYMGNSNPFVGVDSFGFFGNLGWYLKGPLVWGAAFPIAIMSLPGFLLSLRRRKKQDLLIALFPLLYLVLLGVGKFRWERYAVTLMPFLALYASIFFYNSFGLIQLKNFLLRWRNVLLSLSIVAIIGYPTLNIVRYDYLLTQEDTRVEAKNWVEDNIPAKAKIGQDAYTGDLNNEIFEITKKFTLSDMPLSYYYENGYQYLIVSDTQYERYLAEPKKYFRNVLFYRTLFVEGRLVKDIYPKAGLWPEPTDRFLKYHIHVSPRIKIFKLNSH